MPAGPHSTGEAVGHYRIIRRLGAGGMGEVFLAHDTVLVRDVALKFLAPVDHDQKQYPALLKEARAASRLDHPNVGAIFGLEETADGEPFLVMAYYDGETLHQRLRRGTLTYQEATEIALQTARGLAAAHAQRIVHRDIKPSNLILTPDGIVKIVDFGIARASTPSDRTQSMTISGTAAYLSPEQAQGLSIDQRADIWAFGVVLAEMLTGKPVFERDSHPATLYAIVHSPVPVLPATIPPVLQSVIYRSLAKDPARRYQSSGEIIHDLAAATGPVPSGRLSAYRRLASGLPSKKWLRLSMAIAFVLVAVALGFVYAFFRPPSFSATAPHLAALPISASAQDQVLGDGLMETITNRLSNYQSENPDLWIVPISEVHRQKVTDPTLAHKSLNASLVITCTLQRQGQTMHLLLHLIDATNLRQIGAGEFTGDLSEIEDQAVSRLATLMHLRVSNQTQFIARSQPSSYETYLKALGYLQRYDHIESIDQAITLLKDVTAIDPKFAMAFTSLGEAYRTKARLTKDDSLFSLAEASVSKALAIDGNIADAHFVMGGVQAGLGHQDLALAEFRRALDLNPSNADAYTGIARIYADQGRLVEAESMYRKAIALRPEYWQGYNSFGIFLKHKQRFDEAIDQFKRVIELTPDNAAAYSNLGSTYIEAGRFDEAQMPLEKAIQFSPTNYAAYSNLGLLFMKQSNYRQAAEETERALKLNGRDWMVWQNLGTCYQWLHDSVRAISSFKRSISLLESTFAIQSPQPETRADYAEMLLFSGNKTKAQHQYASALALAPDEPTVLIVGATLYHASGDTRRAIALASKAVSKGLTLDQIKQDPNSQWLLTNPEFKIPSR